MNRYYYVLHLYHCSSRNSFEEKGENGLYSSYDAASAAAKQEIARYNLERESLNCDKKTNFDVDIEPDFGYEIREI